MKLAKSTQTPFTEVSLNGQSNGTEILDAIQEEESRLHAELAEAQRKLDEVAAARAKAEAIKAEQLRNRRNELFEKARIHRETARNEVEPASKVELIAIAEAAEREARSLHIEGEEPVDHALPDAPKFLGLSTSKGIVGIAILALISAVLFYTVGTSLIQDEANDSAARMMNSVGLRVVTNFFIFSLSLLVPAGFIYLIFPSVFSYWHNRIESKINLINDLENASAWQRLSFFAFVYGLPVWAFVTLMQVIFG